MTDTLRVFEAFSGVGSQHMALRNIGLNFEVVGTSDWDINATLSYNEIHSKSKIDFDEYERETGKKSPDDPNK